MEEELDEVEEGKMTWAKRSPSSNKKFEKDLKQGFEDMRNLKKQENPHGRSLRKGAAARCHQVGQFGRFMAFPGIRSARHEGNHKRRSSEGRRGFSRVRAEPCENCGKTNGAKRGRFGQFLACTGYPECKTTRKDRGRHQDSEENPMSRSTRPARQCGQAKLMLKEGRFGEFISCGIIRNANTSSPRRSASHVRSLDAAVN